MAFAYQKRMRGNFDPTDSKPFRISRSRIDLYLECPRCFYLDQRLGIKRPDTPPFSLNNAVDLLLKKEFDIHRKGKTPHPLMKAYGLKAVPYQHKDLDTWRDALRGGIEYLHKSTNLSVRGGIDDVWVNTDGELIIVDYKATSKTTEINLDAEWQDGYKRQMEVYQWLFRQNGFTVSDTGYFVYVNGKQDKDAFDGKLEFDIILLPYTGSTDWIEPTLFKIKESLTLDTLPEPSSECVYCSYRKFAAEEAAKEKSAKTAKKSIRKNEEDKQQSKIFG